MSIGETECSTVDTTARNAAQYSNRTARDIRVRASSNQANILYQRFAIDRRRELTGFTSYSAVEDVGFPDGTGRRQRNTVSEPLQDTGLPKRRTADDNHVSQGKIAPQILAWYNFYDAGLIIGFHPPDDLNQCV